MAPCSLALPPDVDRPDWEDDADDDGLTRAEEAQAGTNRTLQDTDRDGLLDGVEVKVLDLDPTRFDTDGDGTPDCREDVDGDGLTNAEELVAQSDPTRTDGDHDGIPDPDELANGTDPKAIDTDEDGLDDATELSPSIDTDPTNPDTDGDGTLDGNEVRASTLEREKLEAKAVFVGPGNVSDHSEIRNGSVAIFRHDSLDNVTVSHFVEVVSHSPVDTVTLTLGYDEAQVPGGEERNLTMYGFNWSIQTFVPVPSTVNPTDDTVTTSPLTPSEIPEGEEASREYRPMAFVVFHEPSWNRLWEDSPANGS